MHVGMKTELITPKALRVATLQDRSRVAGKIRTLAVASSETSAPSIEKLSYQGARFFDL